MNFSVLIGKMVIFSSLMVIGYVFARRGLVDRSFGRAASMLTLNVFLPATILNSVFVADMSLAPGELWKLMLLLFLTLGVGYGFGFVLGRLLPLGRDKMRGPVYELLFAMSNTMFIGMPIAQELFGPIAVFYCALSCIPFNLYAYTYAVWRMKGGAGGSLRIRDVFSVALGATLLAVIIFVFHLPVPGIVRNLASVLNGATLPMSLLVIGFSMGTVSLFDAFRNRSLYLSSFLRNLAVPVVTWLILRLFTDDSVLLMTCMLLAASPSAVLVTVFAIQFDRDSVFAAEGVLQSTVLSIATIPFLLLLLG